MVRGHGAAPAGVCGVGELKLLGLGGRAGPPLLSAQSASVVIVDSDAKIACAARKPADTACPPVRVSLLGEPHVQNRHAEVVRLRGALHNLRRPFGVLVYSNAKVEGWGEVPGTAVHTALTPGRVLAES